MRTMNTIRRIALLALASSILAGGVTAAQATSGPAAGNAATRANSSVAADGWDGSEWPVVPPVPA